MPRCNLIFPSDEDYKETKRILQRKADIKPEMQPLADWTGDTFGVNPINIVYDWIKIKSGKRPRLEICFELEADCAKFNFRDFQYDPAKQKAIADGFRRILQEQGTPEKSNLLGRLLPKPQPKYSGENLLVIFGAFDRVAKDEANTHISDDELMELQESLNAPDLWNISRMFSRATFFLYTDRQVKGYENSSTRTEWTNRYFDLWDRYNEFGYFKRETFSIRLDSKENFDTNYQSNWYDYYK